MQNKQTDTQPSPRPRKWGVIKIIEFQEHYLQLDAGLRRSWHPTKEEGTDLLSFDAARDHARSAGALVIDLETSQVELQLES